MSKTLQYLTPAPDAKLSLSSIFKNQPNLAWEMLQQECNIYTCPNIDVEEINRLSMLYSKILLKLNELQDPRQKYFSNKLQKLMAEPFVIRCYNDCTQKKQVNNDLKQKRKQLQQKLSIQSEKQNSQAYQHIIQSQNQKQKKLKEKISQVIEQHEKNLENRLKLRSMKKDYSSPRKKNSEDSILVTSQMGNPEFATPRKNQDFNELKFLDFAGLKNRSQTYYSNRPQSQRIFNEKFDHRDESSDSEDEYRIQKMLIEEKRKMAKKSRAELYEKSLNKDKL